MVGGPWASIKKDARGQSSVTKDGSKVKGSGGSESRSHRPTAGIYGAMVWSSAVVVVLMTVLARGGGYFELPLSFAEPRGTPPANNAVAQPDDDAIVPASLPMTVLFQLENNTLLT